VRKPTTHLRLRIEPKLLQRLTNAAEKNMRTLTGEIIERLEDSFRPQEQQQLVTATVENTLSVLVDKGIIKRISRAARLTSQSNPAKGGKS
jgi:hypothetical protein